MLRNKRYISYSFLVMITILTRPQQESLRVHFAETAAGLKEWMDRFNDGIAHLEGNLEEQLKALKEKRAERAAAGNDKYEAARAAHDKVHPDC